MAKLLVLKLFQEFNDRQLVYTNDILTHSTITTKNLNNTIDQMQATHVNRLPLIMQWDINTENSQTQSQINAIRNRIDNLNLDDSYTEVTQVSLERLILEKKVESTKRVGNILNTFLGDLGTEHNQLGSFRDRLVDRNNILKNIHLDLVRTNVELQREIDNATNDLNNNGNGDTHSNNNGNGDNDNNSGNGSGGGTGTNNNGSIIDDYANPNLEQASFMDPED